MGACGIVGVGKWGGGGQRLGMGWTDEGRVHGGGGEYRMLMGGDAGGGEMMLLGNPHPLRTPPPQIPPNPPVIRSYRHHCVGLRGPGPPRTAQIGG